MTILISRTLADNIVITKKIVPTPENDFLSGIQIASFEENNPLTRKAAAMTAITFAESNGSEIEISHDFVNNGSSPLSFAKSMKNHIAKAVALFNLEVEEV